MAEQNNPLHSGKIRHCWYCGADMGWIENRYYERNDPCGKIECNRAARDAYAEERQNAHDDLDRNVYGGDGW